MTTEKTLSALYQIATQQEGYSPDFFKRAITETKKFSNCGVAIFDIAGLIHELEDDLRSQTAKKSGNTNQLTAAKRILKMDKFDKPALKYAYNTDEFQYICNGYVIIKLPIDKALPLEQLPENIEPLDYEKFIPEIYSSDEELELPDMAKLKSYIKIEKAKMPKQKGVKPVVHFDFGVGKMYFDAELLIDVMSLVPNATAKMSSKSPFMIVLENEDGCVGVCCAVRIPDNLERKRTEI